MKDKLSFWNNITRRLMFLTGIGFVIIGMILVIVASTWSEALVTSIQTQPGFCSDNKQPYVITYTVDSKDYTISTCLASATLKSVIYYPIDPSITLMNTPIVNKVIGGAMIVLGLLFAWGAVFLREPRQGELGYEPPDRVSINDILKR